MLWTLILTGLAWGADCTEAVKAQQINALVQDALMGFATMDEEGFYASTEEAEAMLPCLDEVFLPPNAAGYHRLLAIRAFYDGDDATSTAAFRAALVVEPDYELSDKIAPEGGKLHRAYEDARSLPTARFARLRMPGVTTIFVNGSAVDSQPSDVPAIVQLSQRGEVQWTGYIQPGEALPEEFTTMADAEEEEVEQVQEFTTRADAERERREARANSSRESSSRDRDSSSRDRDRDRDDRDTREADDRGRELAKAPPTKRPKERSGGGGASSGLMWGLAGGSAVLAGGLFATSAVSRGGWEDAPTPGKKTLTNGAYFGSIGFGVAALGFSGAALFGGE